MSLKRFSGLVLVFFFCSSPVFTFAQTSSQNSSYFKKVLYELLVSMEMVAGIEPKASSEVLQSSDEEIEALFGLIRDKEGFFAAAKRIRDYIESGSTPILDDSSVVQEKLPASPQALGSEPFPPDYPSNSGLYNDKIVAELKLYGLLSSAQERCNSTALSDYWSIWWEAYSAATIGDFVCNVAGCDPTGIACGIICGISNTAMGAVFVAQRPVDLCNFHDANIDSAELQAGFENSVSIINNLNEHDVDIKEYLDRIEGRQNDMEEIQLESLVADIRNEALAGLYLPEEQGGKLETVGELVMKRIKQQKDAGLDVGIAQKHIDSAIHAYIAGDYKGAFRYLKLAYRQLQQ